MAQASVEGISLQQADFQTSGQKSQEPFFPNLLQKKVLLVTGKGGIGKTLLSAALAQAAAAQGKKVLLLEFGAVDQIAPLFGVPHVGHERREVAPQIFCANLNPKDNFRDFVVKYLGQKKLFDRVISHRVIQTLIKTIPGLAELMILGRLYFEGAVAPGVRFDLIVFDGPASGHFLNMMTTPDAVLQSNIIGPVRKETERVKNFLSQKDQVGCLYVTIPEELVISEALDFIPLLQAKSPAALAGVVVNKVPRSWCGFHDRPLMAEELVPLSSGLGAPLAGEGTSASYTQVLHHARRESLERARRALALFDQGMALIQRGPSTGAQAVGSTLGRWDLPDLFSVKEPLDPDLWRQLLTHKGGPLAAKS